MMPDTIPSSPKTEIEKALEAEANLAKYRKAIAEANEAEAKAEKEKTDSLNATVDAERNKWQAPEIKALDGKITATGSFIETQILANKCLSELVNKLIDRIFKNEPFKNNPSNFVLYNAADFPNIEQYESFIDHLNVLKSILEDAIEQGKNSQTQTEADALGGFAPMAVGLAAGGILRTAADIFSLFKQNTTITNIDIPTEDSLIISVFSSKLREKHNNCKVYYPAGYPVYLIEIPPAKPSEFTKLFNLVKNTAIKASLLQQKIERESTEIDKQLMIVTDPAQKSMLENKKTKLSNGLSGLQSATSAFSQLEMTLVAIDSNTKLSLRALILRAEKLVALLKESNTYIIKLSAKLNGSTKIKEGLFRMTKAMHSGGAQLNCLIFSNDGSILFSENLCTYISYKESSDITNVKLG